MSLSLEAIVENMGFWMHAPVLIERRNPDGSKFIPGVISGVDEGRRKVLITGLIEGLGYSAPIELLQNGQAESRRGHLRYRLLPISSK